MSRFNPIFAAVAGLALASGTALADPSNHPYDERRDARGDFDFADVVHVEPIRRQVRPFSYNHVRGTLLGGAIGTVVGNQIGRGRGKDVARVAGALIGGAIGHNVSVDRERQLGGPPARGYERCEVRYRDSFEERIDGYDVTYAYAGREYVTRMPYDPGERIQVRVDVTPVGG